MTSGFLDGLVVAAVGICLRRLRHQPALSPDRRAQWEALAIAGCYFVGATAFAGRTPGQAALGLRVVDEGGRGRPTWRASMIRWAVRQPTQIVFITVGGASSIQRAAEEMEELKPELAELRRRHEGDPRRLNEAVSDLYRSRGVRPWTGCWPVLAASLIGVVYDAIITAGVLHSPSRQGFHDRLARTLVVDCRR